ncbi:MAG: hypothetical protein ACFFDK_19505 [Promethearchaeota archaeon]
MVNTEEKTLLNIICPYCQVSFKKYIEHTKKQGLFTVLINEHPDNENCPPFIAFIDDNGKHRGSQKIDDAGDVSSVNGELLESAMERINELKKTLRFYHLKVPRKDSRGFEYKVANVADRSFMSSKFYLTLIEFLTENDDDNIFGAVGIPLEDGLLVYGKYLGMVYTIFWTDQKSLQNKTLDDLKGYANLTIEQLIEIYDLMDFFF